ncbi:MAG: 50S ribosomal protein L9 [Crocinitomicaceae bacterium]|nr:50S ribosomal protein L9 [Crocinitomicaceae bacterium]|tara:strand:+ start:165 stop:611 length:447 start_codon:yes stop_codon:yes gene_type:complete
MEVLLKKDIERLGSKYEVVEVKNGYGRNFLIPKGLAILATDAVKKMHLETIKQRAHKDNQLRDEAAKIYKKMSKKTFQVPAKVGENGKIFGSITNIQLADSINKAGFKVERKNITLPTGNLKSIGKFQADIVLHKEVKGKISFEIVEG